MQRFILSRKLITGNQIWQKNGGDWHSRRRVFKINGLKITSIAGIKCQKMTLVLKLTQFAVNEIHGERDLR